MAMEPASPQRFLPEERLEEVALAFADFADLKAPHLAGHSRRVADLAELIARRMLLRESEVATIRLAALMHDLGLVAVPSFTLEKHAERLTPAEWERLRLHPYYAERILSQVPAFAPFVPLVAAHHERPDGRGYHRGLPQAQIPLGARIIAVADQFDDCTHDRPGQSALDSEAALSRLGAEGGPGPLPGCLSRPRAGVGRGQARTRPGCGADDSSRNGPPGADRIARWKRCACSRRA